MQTKHACGSNGAIRSDWHVFIDEDYRLFRSSVYVLQAQSCRASSPFPAPMRPQICLHTNHQSLCWPGSYLRRLTRGPSHGADSLWRESCRQHRLQSTQLLHAAGLPPKASSSAYEAPLKRQRLSTKLLEPQPAYAVCTSTRSGSLRQLQAFLGYQFNSQQLLDQACTHSSDKGALSYRQLAFLGDAALWLLFAEHAYHTYGDTEDPVSGAWPARLSAILSRANCAATARAWGLQHYLQHSQQQQQQQPTISSSSSSSSSSRGGMHQGAWSSDSLAEMFEGIIGALLLDSNYATVRQLLQPWVAAAFAASRAAAAAAAAATGPAVQETTIDTTAKGSSERSTGAMGQQAAYTTSAATVAVVAAAATSTATDLISISNSRSWQVDEQHQLTAEQQTAVHTNALYQQLQAVSSYQFKNQGLLKACCRHIMLLLVNNTSSAEDEKMHFLGYSLLQYAAAQHSYNCHCAEEPSDVGLQNVHSSSSSGSNSSRTSSHSSSQDEKLQQMSSSSSSSTNNPISSSSDGSSSSSRGSSSRNVLQSMAKQMVNMTTIRHRCKMWLWLGLDPAAWCPSDSHLFSVKWKVQKQLVSRCLDLLLAAVYLDGGLDAALGVLGVLLPGTPPTGMDKSWIPDWANKGAAAVNPGRVQPLARDHEMDGRSVSSSSSDSNCNSKRSAR